MFMLVCQILTRYLDKQIIYGKRNRVFGWGHALQVCQISTRYLDKQIIYGKRNRTTPSNCIKIWDEIAI